MIDHLIELDGRLLAKIETRQHLLLLLITHLHPRVVLLQVYLLMSWRRLHELNVVAALRLLDSLLIHLTKDTHANAARCVKLQVERRL